MKERWIALAARIDALTLRERVLVFAALAAACVSLAWFLGLGPMFKQQEVLRVQIAEQREAVAGADSAIANKVIESGVDPDAATRARIAAVLAETGTLATSLRAVQNGLVAPERMAPLVDAILRANGRLELVQMRTMPVEPVQGGVGATPAPDGTAGAAGNARPAAPAALLYRHGVEVVVRGNYLDMIAYMAALESMPTQLFWGRAQLETETWPASRLTLTLHTLSLDEKWMKL